MGRPPGGPAFIADVLVQQEGLHAGLGGLEISNRILAGGADRLVRARGDIDRREIPGAHQPGERQSVTSVSLHAIAWFLRDERGGKHPADEVLLGERAVEPIPTGTGLIDTEKMRGLRLECADPGIDVALPGADSAQEDHLGAPLFRDLGNGDRLLGHIQTDVYRVSLSHG